MKWMDWCLFAASQLLGFVLIGFGLPKIAFVLLFPSTFLMWFLGEPLAYAVMKDQFHESVAIILLMLLNALFWIAVSRVIRKLHLRSTAVK